MTNLHGNVAYEQGTNDVSLHGYVAYEGYSHEQDPAVWQPLWEIGWEHYINLYVYGFHGIFEFKCIVMFIYLFFFML